MRYENIPGFFQLGIGLCDLINRISGKSAIIKGVQRNPKNSTAVVGNINKALGYLRNFPKMKSKYLWSA